MYKESGYSSSTENMAVLTCFGFSSRQREVRVTQNVLFSKPVNIISAISTSMCADDFQIVCCFVVEKIRCNVFVKKLLIYLKILFYY